MPKGGPDTRRRLYDALVRYPGLHLAELARQARLSEDLARYHLRVLVKRGIATEVTEERFVRYYPRVEGELGPREVVDRADKPALKLLRRPVPLNMVLALLASDGPLRMGELASEVGVSPGTATYHVKNLAGVDLVAVDARDGGRYVRLVDAARVVRLLTAYPPPRDVVSDFVSLWDELGLGVE